MSEKFYLYMELSEDKMLRDGVDIEDCKNELDRVVLSHKGIKEGEGCYSFKTFMTREVASYVWSENEWFMKYVTKWWYGEDSSETSMIDCCRRMGEKVAYA